MAPETPPTLVPTTHAELAPTTTAADRTPAAPTEPPPPAAPEPIPHAGEMVAMAVSGHGDAVVALPAEGTAPHPVVVAAHANWDRPSWECDYWRRIFPTAVVLCPRGILRPDSPSADDPRFTYASDDALATELAASLAALERDFGPYIDTEVMLWVGLSRGAFLGAELAPHQAARFPRMILVEGGHDPWTHANAKAFADAGGERVLFVCGQGACTIQARKAARVLEQHGVGTRIEDVPGMGHGLNHDATPRVRDALPWLFGQDG